MKILKLVNSKDGGGVFNCEKQFLKEFGTEGVEVDLVIFGDGKNKASYTELSSSYICLPEIDSYKSGTFFNRVLDVYKSYKSGLKYKRVIIERFRDTKYDAVIYRRQYYNFIAASLGTHFHCKVYWHLPTVIKSRFLKFIHSGLLRFLKIIPIANSKYTKSTLGSICKYVIYPGFDKSRIAQQTNSPYYRNKFNIPDSSIVYGIAARIYPGKAHRLVIKAFVQSGMYERGHYLLIAGKVVDKSYWNAILEEFNPFFGKRIIYLQEIENIKLFYESIDVLINGGTEAEAFGISVAEALGSNKVVIAYGLGGPKEMVEEGTNGWIVENPDVGSYIRALLKSELPKSTLIDIGKRSEEKATLFSVETNVKKLLTIIANEQKSHNKGKNT